MQWKEFFKPTKSKILLTALLLLIIPVFWINFGNPFCSALGGCPGSISIHIPLVDVIAKYLAPSIIDPHIVRCSVFDYILDLLHPLHSMISYSNSCVQHMNLSTFYFNIIIAYTLASLYYTKFKKFFLKNNT